MTGCNFTVDEFIVHIVLCALDLLGIHRRGKTPHQTESENDKEFGRKLFLVLLAMTVNFFLSKKGERSIGKHSIDRIECCYYIHVDSSMTISFPARVNFR